MSENIEILDSSGNPTGKYMSRKEIHINGYYHQVIALMIVNEQNQILLQKRSSNRSYPSMLHISVGGHIGFGEDIKETLIRETEEELGIKLDQKMIIDIGFNYGPIIGEIEDKQFSNNFIYFDKINLDEIKFDKNEVENIFYYDLDKLESDIKGDGYNKFVPHPREYYLNFVTHIRKHL
jgi:isopentenyldiphosphate isomerase